MKAARRLGGFFPYALGVVLVAGVVHIVSVLAMPALAPRDAYARFGEWAPVNELAPAPESARDGAAPAPFNDPAMLIAACRFDLSGGPVRVAATVDREHFLSMSFQGRTGRIFHSLTDRGALRDRIDVLLLRQQDVEAVEDAESEDEAHQTLRLVAPTTTGLVIVRSLAESPQDRDAARARLRNVRCAVEPPA